MKTNRFLVRINCMTYNHSSYIKDTMDGFCMQQTDFPFICTIFDDNSTDGEQDVIRKYLDNNFIKNDETIKMTKETDDYTLIYTRHKTNANCFFAVYFLKYNHYQLKKSRDPYLLQEWKDTKYIALCEGDDYWTDPLKLQKQVDILEREPNVSMVYTAFINVDQDSNIISRDVYEQFMKESRSGNNLKRIFEGNYILTLTICFRKSVYESDLFSNSPSKIDYSIFMTASFLGDVVYIPDKTSCYRYNPNSMISTKPKVIYDAVELSKKYYIKKFYQGLCKKNMTIRETKEIKETIFFQRMYKKDIKTILYIVCSDFYTFKLLFIYIFNQIKSIAKHILTIPWKESCKND